MIYNKARTGRTLGYVQSVLCHACSSSSGTNYIHYVFYRHYYDMMLDYYICFNKSIYSRQDKDNSPRTNLMSIMTINKGRV